MNRTQLSSAAPPPRKKSFAGAVVAVVILLGLAAGGYWAYDHHRSEAHAARLAAERREKAHRAALAREARLKAAREREAREAAEKARREAEAQAAEKARLAAQEAERLRRLREEEEKRRTAGREKPEPPPPAPAPVQEPPAKPSIYDAPLTMCGGRSNAADNVNRFEKMLDHLVAEGDFEAAWKGFSAKIAANAPQLVTAGVLRYPAYKSSKIYMRAADLCLLIHKAKAADLSGLLAEPGGKEFFTWLLHDKSRPLHLLMQVAASEQAPAAHMAHTIGMWKKLWVETPEKDRSKYTNLALACALLPPGFENSPGKVRQPKGPLLTVPQIYAYFREMDAQKKLLTDVRTMHPSDLLYVVNVRLPRSEFDWVLENLDYARENWGAAYGSIRYRMDRATQNKDPYTTYEFAELRREGGVCRDQGYFAATTAKCKGIPSVYITGDGDRGGHAWVAMMVDDATWKQTGSYGYKTGRFTNPCSGRGMHESVLLGRDRKSSPEKLAPAYDAMALSEVFVALGLTEESWAAARYAANAFSTSTAPWANLVRVMGHDEKHRPDVAAWKKIVLSLQREGRDNPELLDLAADVEDEYIAQTKTATAQKSAIARSLKKLKRSAGDGRSDLLVEAVKRQADILAEAKDYRGLAAMYKKALKENAGRGDIIQQLLGQYISYVKDDPARMLTLAKDAEAIFNKQIATGTGDYFKLTKEVAIQKTIANAYQLGGNPKKAAALHEEADARLKAAKSRYQ